VDRAKAIITAMESIEKDYTSLAGTLPKAEYTELDNAVLGDLLRVFPFLPSDIEPGGEIPEMHRRNS